MTTIINDKIKQYTLHLIDKCDLVIMKKVKEDDYGFTTTTYKVIKYREDSTWNGEEGNYMNMRVLIDCFTYSHYMLIDENYSIIIEESK
jgi:hypothetical protein